ncbi:MAG: ABC transporter ATP-binding protein [Candidatus Thorarchaeota archaeon]|nr:ABC transporter ATP-binding protein [Candidatus Thorarchaeota archaeon]
MTGISISVDALSFSYGRTRALDNVSFSIEPGVTGIVGVNGAGKTTLLKLILGLLQPQKGRVLLDGLPVHPMSSDVRSRIGFVPEVPPVDRELSVTEYTRFFKGLMDAYGFPTHDVIETLRVVGFASVEHRNTDRLSRGMMQRLSLAQALLAPRDLLVLDEPMAHLDPLGRIDFRRLMQTRAAEGATIVISTHILADLEACDSIMVLNHGRLLYSGPVMDLRRKYAVSEGCWTIETDQPEELAAQLKSSLGGVRVEHVSDSVLTVRGGNAEMKRTLFQILSQDHTIEIHRFIDGLPTLEDLLLRILEAKRE